MHKYFNMQDETGAAAVPTFRVRKGSWTEEEDILLRGCIDEYGEGNWHQVPKRAGLNRCRKSCRLRWLNYLRPSIKRGRFSPDEVDFMVRLHKLLGNRWALIAGRLPGRTTNDVKNYWNTHHHRKRTPESKKSINTTTYTTNRAAAKTTFATTTEIIKPRPMTFKKTSPWVRRRYSEPTFMYNYQNIATYTPEQQPPLRSMFHVNKDNTGAGANAIQLASLIELDEAQEKIDNNHEPDSQLGSTSRSVSGLFINSTNEDKDMVPKLTNDVTKNRSLQQNKNINFTTRRVPSTTSSPMTEIIKPQPRTFSKPSPWVLNSDAEEMLTYDEQISTRAEQQQQLPLSTLFHAQEDNINDNIMWWEGLLELDEVMEKIDNNNHEPNSGSGSQSRLMSGIATSSTSEDEHIVKLGNIMNEEEAFVEGSNNWEDFCLDVQFWDIINGT